MNAEIRHRVSWTRRTRTPEGAIGNLADFPTEAAAREEFDAKCADQTVTRASVMMIVEITTCTHSKS